MALIKGDAAIVAEDIPNKDATGLRQTPAQAPPLQHERRIGAADESPPVIVVHNEFFDFIEPL
jgi:hypothetical protein